MKYETILYNIAEDIARITLNRPDEMNGLTGQMRADLLHAVRRAEAEARVLVITGAGNSFCSGQDLGGRISRTKLELERVLREEYEPMLQALYTCKIPTIAAVNGAATGVGANLALAADIVIAAESAVFVQAFARVGLVPDTGSTYWLPRQIGFAKAMGAALFAERVTAAKAEAWGMIWECAPDDAFAAIVSARATQLANGPTAAYGLIKDALRSSFENTLSDQLDLEATLQGKAGRTRDATEGLVAFQEGRAAKFEGR